MGAERSTFVIGADGRISAVRKVKAGGLRCPSEKCAARLTAPSLRYVAERTAHRRCLERRTELQGEASGACIALRRKRILLNYLYGIIEEAPEGENLQA